MSSLLASAAVLALAASGAASAAQVDPHLYLFEIQVLSAPADSGHELSVSAAHAELQNTHGAPGDRVGVFSAIDEVRVGPLTLHPSEDGRLLWDGATEPPPAGGVEILSQPRITTADGQRAVVRTGSSSGLEYMERQPDGCYRVRVLPPELSPGMVLELTPHSVAGNADEVEVDYSLRLVTIGDREPVSGTHLDVGRPTLGTRETQTRLSLALDTWTLVSVQVVRPKDAAADSHLLVLIRASRVR